MLPAGAFFAVLGGSMARRANLPGAPRGGRIRDVMTTLQALAMP